jgi:hypothetical protein
MTNQNHPITPPPELVQEWREESSTGELHFSFSPQYLATRAARWGADQELEACIEWLREYHQGKRAGGTENLRRSRRPKPPSLKEQALDELASAERLYPADWSTIRCALEALPE